MKVFRILSKSIKDSFKSIFRNLSLSMASIICTTITLILVAVTLIISANVNSFTKDLERDLTIVAFMKRDATLEDAINFEKKLSELENVENIKFESKETVKNSMQDESEIFKTIMGSWDEENNPLQHQFLIKVKEVTDIKKTASDINKLEGIDTVKYGEEMVDQMISIFSIVEKATIAIVLALILVTIFLIANTIKLTILSRKSEIEIMRLVGTSNIVIKLPFLFEGFVLGVIGSIIPVVVTIYGYIYAYEQLDGYLFSNIIRMIEPTAFVYYVALIVLAIGSLVGMFGSYRSVRKYLKI